MLQTSSVEISRNLQKSETFLCDVLSDNKLGKPDRTLYVFSRRRRQKIYLQDLIAKHPWEAQIRVYDEKQS